MTIRTLVEVRGGRVSIVEDGNETQVTITRGEVQSAARKICNWCPRGTWDNRFHPDGASHVRLYTAEEVGNAQADEAEMIATPLRRRISELEQMLVASNDRENKLEAERDALLLKIKSMESDLSEYAEGLDISGDKIRSLEAERDTHKREREENREWAERTEDHLETRTRERDVATNKLSLIRSALTHRELPHSERVSNALALLD